MILNRVLEIFAVIGFSVLMVSLPWEEMQGYKFVDLNVYRDYFLYQKPVFEYVNFTSFIDYITREALWHYSGMFLIRTLGIPADYVFLFISLFCCLTFSYFLVRQQGIPSLILLINPLLVTLAMSQLRSALAFSLLLIAYMAKPKVIKLVVTITALFIHTSVALFLPIFFFISFVAKRVTQFKTGKISAYIILCLLGLFVSVLIGPLKDIVLGYFGDRRSEYVIDASSSFLYTVFWIGLLIVAGLQERSFFKKEVHCFTVTILSIVTSNLFTGGYSLRFLSLALPMTMSTMLDFKNPFKFLLIIGYIAYMIFQWTYWLQIKIL